MTIYTDLNSSFRENIKENSTSVNDMKSIIKGLERLFTTGKGEVPFNRNYGTSLKHLLFENNLHPSDAAMFLYMDITTWEPRVSLSPADIHIDKIDNNSYRVSCAFTVPSLNGVSSVAQAILTK